MFFEPLCKKREKAVKIVWMKSANSLWINRF